VARGALLERFLRATVHRLNNDLVVIAGFADLLRHGERNAARRAQLEDVAEKGRDATRLLALYAALADRGAVEPRAHDLGVLVREAVQLLGPTIVHEGRAVLEERVAARLAPVRADRARLLQWIAAVAAASLTASGGAPEPSAAAPGPRLRLAAFVTGRAVRLRWTTLLPRAAGAGAAASIADALARVLAETAAVPRSFGAASRVRWRSERVCTVTLDFDPVGEVAPVAPAPVLPGTAAEAPRAARSARVLVCMEEPMLAELVGDVLRGVGHAARCTVGPEEAERTLTGARWDLVLVDGALGARGRALASSAAAAGARRGWIGAESGDVRADHTPPPGEPWLPKPFRPGELLAFVARRLE
jgi:hypothetical protein